MICCTYFREGFAKQTLFRANSYSLLNADYKSVCEEKKLDVSGYSVISLLPSKEFGKHLGDLPRAMRRLLTNVPFMTLNFAVSFNRENPLVSF